MFLDWENLPNLNNIEVTVRLGGVSFYVENRCHAIDEGICDEVKVEPKAEFSCDLKGISCDLLMTIFFGERFEKRSIEKKCDVRLSFYDLSSNARYTATFPDDHVSGRCLGDHDIQIARRRSKHIENVLVKNGNSITYHNFVSSDIEYSPEKSELLKGFVKAAVKDDLHREKGASTLYYDTLFSVFNVSFVKRVTLVKEDIRVDIDSVSKKTHQRNGQFEEITRVSLSCPNLCAGIKELQECPENESLRKSVERLYNHLIDCAEEIAEVVDLKTANLPERPFYS